MYKKKILMLSSVNASHEENMKALMEDATAMAVGMITSIIISVIFNMLSVGLIGWSALRQVSTTSVHTYYGPHLFKIG